MFSGAWVRILQFSIYFYMTLRWSRGKHIETIVSRSWVEVHTWYTNTTKLSPCRCLRPAVSFHPHLSVTAVYVISCVLANPPAPVPRCLLHQVGLPADKNQYIHRLGRTARAGKGGSGLVLLTEAEQGFVREVGCWIFWPLLSVLSTQVYVATL